MIELNKDDVIMFEGEKFRVKDFNITHEYKMKEDKLRECKYKDEIRIDEVTLHDLKAFWDLTCENISLELERVEDKKHER